MKRIILVVLAVLMLMSYAACTSKISVKELEPSFSVAPSEPEISTDEPIQSQESFAELITNNTGRENNSFDISASLDAEEHLLDISQTLTYVNNTGVQLNDIYFNLIPQAFRENGGGVSMEQILVSDETCNLNKVDGTVYSLSLPSPLAAGKSLDIKMHYTVDIPNIQNRFGYQENIYNLGNFIATPAVYENGAWVVEPYVDLGDAFYTEIADYKVAITVPEGFKVAATGVETDGVYIADDVRDFAFCASDSFEVLCDEQDGIALSVYYSGDLDKTAERTMDTAKKSLKLFNELFGKYPYETMNFVINGLTGGVNGMEYPALIMLSPSIPLEEYEKMGYTQDSDEVQMMLEENDRATCHEIAHQWFYGIVGNDQIASPWLDEGMCRFSEYLYQKEYPPAVSAEDDYSLLENRFKDMYMMVSGEGSKSGMSYAPDTTYLGESLYYWMENDPMGYGEVYVKGASLLYQMQQQLGEDAFADALKEYVDTFAYSQVTAEEFESFWNEKQDFSELFKVYFRGKAN